MRMRETVDLLERPDRMGARRAPVRPALETTALAVATTHSDRLTARRHPVSNDEAGGTVITNTDDFWIPCPHEQQTDRPWCTTDTLPDHHPLTPEQVGELYRFALAATDMFRYARAVMRLRQGIEGMTCPQPADGDVADTATWLECFMADAAEGHLAPLPVLVRVLTDGHR